MEFVVKKIILWWVRKILWHKRYNFQAHWDSMVYPDCSVEGFNYVGKRVVCVSTKLGKFTYINNSTKIIMANVGRFTCIGPECLIGGLGAHPINRKSTHRMFYSRNRAEWISYCKEEDFEEKKYTNIGHDVWIGARAILMDGVNVGNGAIVAAGSIVTRDVPPYAIVAGVPAKVVRYRFEPEMVQKLQADAWWNLSEEDLATRCRGGEFSATIGDR
jgi:acetyltransferase-like isoleucine patch superfamily enzyme